MLRSILQLEQRRGMPAWSHTWDGSNPGKKTRGEVGGSATTRGEILGSAPTRTSHQQDWKRTDNGSTDVLGNVESLWPKNKKKSAKAKHLRISRSERLSKHSEEATWSNQEVDQSDVMRGTIGLMKHQELRASPPNFPLSLQMKKHHSWTVWLVKYPVL